VTVPVPAPTAAAPDQPATTQPATAQPATAQPATAQPAAGHRPLLRTIMSLIATTGITSALGVAFWWVAAHRASLASVGNGSAAVSALTLVATFGMAGLNTTLIPHLARRPRHGDGLLSAALWAAALVSGVLAAGFWLIAELAGGGFAPYLHTGPEALVFILGAAVTGASLVLDEALLGLVGGAPQLWRNCAFAVTKLAALAGLTAAWHDELGTPILTAWAGGTAISLVVAAILLRTHGIRLVARPQWTALRRIAREGADNTWLNNALQAPVLLTPILVTGLLSATDGGAFYVAWTVMTIAVMLSFHFTTALYAASAADPGRLGAKLRFTLRICLLGGLVGVPFVVLVARPLLHVFGAQYAARATLPLVIMVGGYFGSVLKNHYVALMRINQQLTKGAVFASVTCVIRLAAVTLGALAGGLVGVAVALLVVMTAEGIYAVPALRKALRKESVMSARQSRPPGNPGYGQARATWPAGTRARVVYYLQTHSRPAQVTRLVETICDGSPHALVLISHDREGPPLETAKLAAHNVHVLVEQGGYGDFSHLDRYLAAVDWLDDNGIDYDWLENLTGQDYPIRPIAEIEATLANTDADGFLLYSPVFPARMAAPTSERSADQGNPDYRLCSPFDASMRYDYRHWRFGLPTPAKQRLMRPLMVLNLVQPWIRVSTSFASVGIRQRTGPFGPDFPCYGGSFFCTLRARAARYVRDYAKAHPDVVAQFRTILAADETFIQSILVNAGMFTFVADAKRYIDWTGSKHNHPRTLGMEDLDAVGASDAHWARKLDLEGDARLFDILDQRIRRGPRKLDEHAYTGVCAP
jgi:O-antigen/teichoic acid export membrane protein